MSLQSICMQMNVTVRKGWMVGLLIVVLSCGTDEMLDPMPETDASAMPHTLATGWVDLQLYFVLRSPGFTPPVVSRAFAYCGLAFYESLLPAMPGYVTLQGQLNGIPKGSWPEPEAQRDYSYPISANTAAAQMTRYMFENAPVPDLPKIDSLENVMLTQLRTGLTDEVVLRSIDYGKQVSEAIYALSVTDGGHRGFNRNFPASYVPPKGDGLWIPTNSQLAMLPTWGNNRPFLTDIFSKMPSTTHPPFSTDVSSAFYKEAQEVYTNSQELTDEQTAIAFFWNDDVLATYTPPGHSISILNQLIRHESKSLAFAAEAFVKMGIAQSDAFLVCWKVKYAVNLLRPVTFIQKYIDEYWNALIITPPFPEYTSGHSTQSAAAAAILNNLFGSNYSFTDFTHSSLATGLPPRSFTTFDEMAAEVGASRLYGGIHFSSANKHGREMGYSIGNEVLNLTFRP
jgi:PAP2 superfamily